GGRLHEAIDRYRRALQTEPDKPEFAEGHYNLGNALAAEGDLDGAIAEYGRAIRARPEYVEARHNLGSSRASIGRNDEAVEHVRGAIRIDPGAEASLATLAWILATSPSDTIRSPKEAVRLGERAVELSGRRDPSALDTLAAAYASAGQFELA